MCHQARTSGSPLSPSSSASSLRLPRVGAPTRAARGGVRRAPAELPGAGRLDLVRLRLLRLGSLRLGLFRLGHAAILARGDERPATRHAGGYRSGVRPGGVARQPVGRLRRQDARAHLRRARGRGDPAARRRRGVRRRRCAAPGGRHGRALRAPRRGRATPDRRHDRDRDPARGRPRRLERDRDRDPAGARCVRLGRARPRHHRGDRARGRDRRPRDRGRASGPPDPGARGAAVPRLLRARRGSLRAPRPELAAASVHRLVPRRERAFVAGPRGSAASPRAGRPRDPGDARADRGAGRARPQVPRRVATTRPSAR